MDPDLVCIIYFFSYKTVETFLTKMPNFTKEISWGILEKPYRYLEVWILLILHTVLHFVRNSLLFITNFGSRVGSTSNPRILRRKQSSGSEHWLAITCPGLYSRSTDPDARIDGIRRTFFCYSFSPFTANASTGAWPPRIEEDGRRGQKVEACQRGREEDEDSEGGGGENKEGGRRDLRGRIVLIVDFKSPDLPSLSRFSEIWLLRKWRESISRKKWLDKFEIILPPANTHFWNILACLYRFYRSSNYMCMKLV